LAAKASARTQNDREKKPFLTKAKCFGVLVQLSTEPIPFVVLDIRKGNAGPLSPEFEEAADESTRTIRHTGRGEQKATEHRVSWLRCTADVAANAVRKQSTWVASFPGPGYPQSGTVVIIITESKARFTLLAL
jgi:hypothetical protein